jgi:hypothetical protein
VENMGPVAENGLMSYFPEKLSVVDLDREIA